MNWMAGTMNVNPSFRFTMNRRYLLGIAAIFTIRAISRLRSKP